MTILPKQSTNNCCAVVVSAVYMLSDFTQLGWEMARVCLQARPGGCVFATLAVRPVPSIAGQVTAKWDGTLKLGPLGPSNRYRTCSLLKEPIISCTFQITCNFIFYSFPINSFKTGPCCSNIMLNDLSSICPHFMQFADKICR